MDIKFRILERRGTYRIEYQERQIQFDSRPVFGRVKRKDVCLGWTRWKTILKTDRTEKIMYYGIGGPYTEYRCAPKEFESYESAENYIWEEYGNEGWKRIEEPDWKVV